MIWLATLLTISQAQQQAISQLFSLRQTIKAYQMDCLLRYLHLQSQVKRSIHTAMTRFILNYQAMVATMTMQWII